jgi:hypothetical protein
VVMIVIMRMVVAHGVSPMQSRRVRAGMSGCSFAILACPPLTRAAGIVAKKSPFNLNGLCAR